MIDSSTIITLSELNALDLLENLRGEANVIVPRSVQEELKEGQHGIEIKNVICPPDIYSIKEEGEEEVKGLLEGLGRGEKEVIEIVYGIARKMNRVQAIAITDDLVARKRCKRIGIPVMGILGLIEFAKRRKVITKNQALKIIDSIPSTSLYITQELLVQVRERMEKQKVE